MKLPLCLTLLSVDQEFVHGVMELNDLLFILCFVSRFLLCRSLLWFSFLTLGRTLFQLSLCVFTPLAVIFRFSYVQSGLSRQKFMPMSMCICIIAL